MARALDYVPYLQRQVERLERRNEEGAGSRRRSTYPVAADIRSFPSPISAIQVCTLSTVGKKGMTMTFMDYVILRGS